MASKDDAGIVLSPAHQRLIAEQLRSGRFATPSEVVDEALRRFEESEQLERLLGVDREEVRRQIEEGAAEADRGEFINGEDVFAEWRARDEQARLQHRRPA